jgi:Ser/Thr protein kinase RdoA (MazF antagonist)
MQPFPSTESTLSAVHIGQFLQHHYGLSLATICKLLRTGMNHLYTVADGDKKSVFRVYTHGWRTKHEIASEIKLLLHLSNNELPVSYPLADNNGNYIQSFEAIEGERFGVLFSFAEGRKNPNFSVELSEKIGKNMATMHRLTKDYEFDRVKYDVNTLLQNSLLQTSQFFKPPNPELAFIESLNCRLMATLAKASNEKLPTGAIHLDIWFDNLHITEAGEITFFDFDFCGSGYQCLDIAYFLYQLFTTHATGDGYQLKSEAFLKGYNSIRPISKQETELIPELGLAILLFYIGVQCHTFDTWSNIFLSEDHLRRMTTNMKRWMEFQKIELE